MMIHPSQNIVEIVNSPQFQTEIGQKKDNLFAIIQEQPVIESDLDSFFETNTFYEIVILAQKLRAEIAHEDPRIGQKFKDYFNKNTSKTFAWRLKENDVFDKYFSRNGGGVSGGDFFAEITRNINQKNTTDYLYSYQLLNYESMKLSDADFKNNQNLYSFLEKNFDLLPKTESIAAFMAQFKTRVQDELYAGGLKTDEAIDLCYNYYLSAMNGASSSIDNGLKFKNNLDILVMQKLHKEGKKTALMNLLRQALNFKDENQDKKITKDLKLAQFINENNLLPDIMADKNMQIYMLNLSFLKSNQDSKKDIVKKFNQKMDDFFVQKGTERIGFGYLSTIFYYRNKKLISENSNMQSNSGRETQYIMADSEQYSAETICNLIKNITTNEEGNNFMHIVDFLSSLGYVNIVEGEKKAKEIQESLGELFEWLKKNQIASSKIYDNFYSTQDKIDLLLKVQKPENFDIDRIQAINIQDGKCYISDADQDAVLTHNNLKYYLQVANSVIENKKFSNALLELLSNSNEKNKIDFDNGFIYCDRMKELTDILEKNKDNIIAKINNEEKNQNKEYLGKVEAINNVIQNNCFL